MQNFHIPFLPERSVKPRTNGITMVMDKGLSVAEAENLVSSSGDLIDFVKLGFGTSLITNRLEDKIRVYHKADIKVYFGGTLFEAFLVRNAIDDYIRRCRQFGLEWVEISDGSMEIDHKEKLHMIKEFSKYFSVLSEVGSKKADVILSDEEWVRQINSEMAAGSSIVIAEAREGGNVGIYDASGKPKTDLIDIIKSQTDYDKIMWEAPVKTQQVWFIKKFGTHVNLGNIAPGEVISLETLRLGLRGDTFFDFLPEELL